MPGIRATFIKAPGDSEAMEKHEFVIVGAGPAGLRAAELLAKEGRDVLIVEKMNDKEVGNKVCAGAISPKTINFFPRDLFETFTHKLSFFTPSLDEVMLESEKPFMGMVSRHELGQWQLDRAMSAGAALMDSTEVKGVSINEKKLKTADGEIGYEKLIGAEGTTSVIRKALGMKRKEFLCFQWTLPNVTNEELEVYLNFTRFGFGAMYLFPHDDYIVCGGGGADPRKPIKEFRDYTKKFFEKRFDFSGAVYGAAGVSFDYKGHRFGDITLLGDAGGFGNLLTGEGISQAVLSAEMEFGDREKAEMIRERIILSKRKHDLLLKGYGPADALKITRLADRFIPRLYSLAKGRVVDSWVNSEII
jgi:flavin-dependent dehydrogenase